MADKTSDPSLLQYLSGHRKRITALKFHPNQHELISSSEDESVILWNIQKDVRCYKFKGHTGAVRDVACSSNGKWIVSGSADKTLRLWVPSVRGGSAEIKAHTGGIGTVEFSPDNKTILSGSNDKSLKIWDVHKRTFVMSFTGHNHWINCARHLPDSKLIVSCAEDKSTRVWDCNSKQSVHVFNTPKSSGSHVAVHPCGNNILVAMKSGSVRLYDLKAQKLKQHYVLHDHTTGVAWHPKGKHFASCGMDGTVKIVDAMEGRPLYTATGPGGPITSIAFSADGQYFAFGVDSRVMIWKSNFDEC